ncbi:MAG TPA: molybdopterin molybdotransferase MoeA, partial [Bacteroidia bacterium]|nr:molybdopterin molybdotransferase MoeA [Bacteroidia bacterium]
MISVPEAFDIIKQQVNKLPCHTVALPQAFNCVLAKPVFALYDTPPFNNSAMDGYAFRFADLQYSPNFSVIGSVSAGSTFNGTLMKNEAVRIFTGACIPVDADTVVMQEKTIQNTHTVTVTDEEITLGSNVRLKGSQNKVNEMLVRAGNSINEMIIGYLASAGIDKVTVYQKPSVCIITTGTELIMPGLPLQPGKIFESNSWMLNAALNKMFMQTQLYACDDSMQHLSNLLAAKATETDVIIITGGVSVGDYDFVAPALKQLGAQIFFHKVKQKPGKPLLFAKLNNAFIFGLPGNPASALSCFYNYVKPALHLMQGMVWPMYQTALLQNTFQKKEGLTHFVKSVCNNGG